MTGVIFLLTLMLRGVFNKGGSLVATPIEMLCSPQYLLYERWFRVVHPSTVGKPHDVLLAPTDLMATLVIFMLGIAWWYLLACLVVCGYHKLTPGKPRKS